MKLIDIVREHLETHDYDGLYNPFAECACKKDDLMPCESPGGDCTPRYLQPDEIAEEWGVDFVIGEDKKGAEK